MSKAKLNFKLKWTASDPSTAIMLTFSGNTLAPLLAGELQVLFRKMGPKNFIPTLVYAYVSAPASAVVARFEVESWITSPVDDVIPLATKGLISNSDLSKYARGYSELIVITPARIEEALTPITMKQLSSDYEFWPSSTYIPLSSMGIKTLDQLGQFSTTAQGKQKE